MSGCRQSAHDGLGSGYPTVSSDSATSALLNRRARRRCWAQHHGRSQPVAVASLGRVPATCRQGLRALRHSPPSPPPTGHDLGNPSQRNKVRRNAAPAGPRHEFQPGSTMTVDSNGNIEASKHNFFEIRAGHPQPVWVECGNGVLERMFERALLATLLYLAWGTNVLPNILFE